MAYRTRMDASLRPVGHRPFKEPARLDYRNNAEKKQQLVTAARRHWPTARRVEVDLDAQKILIDGRELGAFELTEPRAHQPAQEGLLP